MTLQIFARASQAHHHNIEVVTQLFIERFSQFLQHDQHPTQEGHHLFKTLFQAIHYLPRDFVDFAHTLSRLGGFTVVGVLRLWEESSSLFQGGLGLEVAQEIPVPLELELEELDS